MIGYNYRVDDQRNIIIDINIIGTETHKKGRNGLYEAVGIKALRLKCICQSKKIRK